MTHKRHPSHRDGTGQSEMPSMGDNIAVALLRHHAIKQLGTLASLVAGLAALGKQPRVLDHEDRARLDAVIAALRAAFILANSVGRHDLVGQFFEAYRGLMKVLDPAKAIPPLEQCWDARWAPKSGRQQSD